MILFFTGSRNGTPFFLLSYTELQGYTHFCLMGNEQKPEVKWLRSGAAKMSPVKIDRDNGMMYDVVMVEEGPAKGHGVHLDGEFIEKITAYDKKHYAKIGLKARFGHPSASSETMGTQLGVFSNFRVREMGGKKQEIADLKLLDAAENSPTHPGMRTWVMDMAEQQPDFIMSSIVFSPSGHYVKKDGRKKMARFFYGDYESERYGWHYWENDTWVKTTEDDLVFVDFETKDGAAHYYTDLVEQGAATDNLFSTKVNQHLFAARVDGFLSENPDIITFLKQNPDAVIKWLQRAGYTVNTQTPPKKMAFNLKSWLMGDDTQKPENEDITALRASLLEAQKEIAALKAGKPETPAEPQPDPIADEVAALKIELGKLTEKLTALAKAPADTPTGGDTPPVGDADKKERAYKKNPLNAHIYDKK